MHSLAIEAQRLGWKVTGSDDEIYEPSRTRLANHGLLPAYQGWNPAAISDEIDLVVLGMHAKADNPELAAAKRLGLKICSYPQFVFELAQDMQRVVVAGSHGKTTITSMIMHVLKAAGRKFNYLVGATVEGFDNPIRLDADAPVIVIEGDEYFASCQDEHPKFLSYKHHIAVISGIAWDHINVFPTLNSYVRQFDHLADASPKGGALIFNDDDPIVSVICNKERPDVTPTPYKAHPHVYEGGKTYLVDKEGHRYEVSFFGDHNMSNIQAAKEATALLGIQEAEFYAAVQTFKGAAKRLERLHVAGPVVYRDFAHAPSKVRATVEAVAQKHAGKAAVGVLELHTFSSLNPDYIAQYKGSLDALPTAAIYLDADVLQKKGKGLTADAALASFGKQGLVVLSNADELKAFYTQHAHSDVWLWMSSGHLGGLDIASLYN